MKNFVRLGFGGLLGWAAYLVAAATLNSSSLVALIAAVAVGIAAVLQFWDLAAHWLGAGPTAIRQIEDILQLKIVEIYDSGHLGKDLTLVSAHVWSVPLWYRTIFPYRARRWLKSTFAKSHQARYGMRPYLARLACFQLPRQPPSGIRFKKGYGLVGVCIEENRRNRVHDISLSGPDFAAALRAGPEAWADEGSRLTKHLSHEDARGLAEKYGQALAVVIQNSQSGEPIGCLTVETRTSFTEPLDGDTALNEMLSSLADFLSPVVERA